MTTQIEYEDWEDDDDLDWIPLSSPDPDDLPQNTASWGPFFFFHGPCRKWEPPLFPVITREISEPWRRGIGIQMHWWVRRAWAVGIWWRGDPPQDLEPGFTPAGHQKVKEISQWRRGRASGM